MRTTKLVFALRAAAARLQSGARYEWGHVGRCNCGHLVQSACELDENEIYRYFGRELSEWTEHANDYCSLTGKPIEKIFDELSALGFSRQDIQHLENLSDARVLKALPGGFRYLKRNHREDVVVYMETLATLLEEESTPSLQEAA